MVTKAMIMEKSISTFGRGFISEVNGNVISVQQCNTSIRYYKLKINGFKGREDDEVITVEVVFMTC